MRLCIYEFNSGKPGYLIQVLFPSAESLSAKPTDLPESILDRLGRQSKLTYFLFHVDLTDSSRVPYLRRELCDALVRHSYELINSNVTNIGKRFIHSTLETLHLGTVRARREGDPEELLLVKTNRNSGGSPELRLSESEHAFLGLEMLSAKRGPSRGYRLLPRKDIDHSIWIEPNFVVERYVTNQDNRFMRGYILLNHIIISEAHECAVIKRMDRAHGRVNYKFVAPDFTRQGGKAPARVMRALDALTILAGAIGLGFGCLDFVLDDYDNVFVVDVNATPHWGEEHAPEVLEHLSLALDYQGRLCH